MRLRMGLFHVRPSAFSIASPQAEARRPTDRQLGFLTEVQFANNNSVQLLIAFFP